MKSDSKQAVRSALTALPKARSGAAGTLASTAPAVGTIIDVSAQARATIALANDERLEARMVASVADRAPESLVGREALVLFEGNDPQRPIVTDLMGPSKGFVDEVAFDDSDGPSLDARVDGREVVIEAEKRLELRCGKASIVIDEEGKISIKGAHLYNRATGPIRIKGGHVDIN
jgi:hypothetical protein